MRRSSSGSKKDMALVALIISVISLGVSLVSTYYALFAPFAPVLTVGGPVLQFGNATSENVDARNAVGPEFDPRPGRVLGGILLPVVVTHEGGRPGVISDIMLKVSLLSDKRPWFFEPRMFFDEHAYLTSLIIHRLRNPLRRPFRRLLLPRPIRSNVSSCFKARKTIAIQEVGFALADI